MNRVNCILLVFSLALAFNASAQTYPVFSQQGKTEILSPVTTPGDLGHWSSQYSPWVMHESGWGSYVMFYCKNVTFNSIQADRIYRAESWTDGKGGYINDTPVIDGATNTTSPEAMSCSPGVAIDNAGTWHMYFIGSPKQIRQEDPIPLTLYHATSTNYGWNWTFPQPVGGISESFPSSYLETPSAIYMSNSDEFVVYYVGPNHGLYKVTLAHDGQTLKAGPGAITTPAEASHGRVTYANGRYYYIYSTSDNPADAPHPNAIYLSTSTSGDSFPSPELVQRSNGSGWDRLHMWSPHLLMDGSTAKIYYAGNVTEADFFGGWASIGVLTGTITDVPCPVVSITSQPRSRTILSGQTTQLLVAANSTKEPVTYRWYRGDSGYTGTPIAGATSPAYTTPALYATTKFWVRVMNGCGRTSDSSTATVTVGSTCPSITIMAQPQSVGVPSGTTAQLSVVATSANPLTYQWYVGASGVTSQPIVGATTSTYTTPPVYGITSYWAQIKNYCGTVVRNSTAATVSVESCPTSITSQPSSTTVQEYGSAQLSVSATSAGALTYQWFSGAPGYGDAISGATSTSYDTGTLVQTTTYYARVSSSCGKVIYSNPATVTVTPRRFAFRSYYGYYLAAEGGGGSVANAPRQSIGSWEKFDVVDLTNAREIYSGDIVNIRTDNGYYYMVAELCGGYNVNVDRGVASYWETFTIRKIDPSSYAFLSGRILAGDYVVLETTCWPVYYVVAEGGGGGVVNANRAVPRQWETFLLTDAP